MEKLTPQSADVTEASKDDEKVLSFFQIRNKFEQISKLSSKGFSNQTPTKPNATNEAKPAIVSTDFQKLYTNFKSEFTKRQFAAMENCFNMADKNEDGFIEPKEMKQLMEDYKQSINLCDAEVIVSIGDHDEDGKLSPKEFIELCKPTAELLREQQHMEGNGPVSDKEFLEIIVQKLRSFVAPTKNAKVRTTRQYFEKMISSSDASDSSLARKTTSTKVKSN